MPSLTPTQPQCFPAPFPPGCLVAATLIHPPLGSITVTRVHAEWTIPVHGFWVHGSMRAVRVESCVMCALVCRYHHDSLCRIAPSSVDPHAQNRNPRVFPAAFAKGTWWPCWAGSVIVIHARFSLLRISGGATLRRVLLRIPGCVLSANTEAGSGNTEVRSGNTEVRCVSGGTAK